jgi:hypothetical protein
VATQSYRGYIFGYASQLPNTGLRPIYVKYQEVCEMLWLITEGILWFIVGGFYFCLMTVAKRADETTQIMYEKEMIKEVESKPIKMNEII